MSEQHPAPLESALDLLEFYGRMSLLMGIWRAPYTSAGENIRQRSFAPEG